MIELPKLLLLLFLMGIPHMDEVGLEYGKSTQPFRSGEVA